VKSLPSVDGFGEEKDWCFKTTEDNVGLQQGDFQEFLSLVEKLAVRKEIRNLISQKFIKNVFFVWLEKSYKKEFESEFIEYFIRRADEEVSNSYCYTGQERDEAPSGLYNLRARYYAAGIGRFTQEDSYYSISGMSGSNSCLGCHLGATRILVDDPRYVNFYTYSLNSPMNYSDITGLSPAGDWNPCEAWDECLEGVNTTYDKRQELTMKLWIDCKNSIDFCVNPEKIDKCFADYNRRKYFASKRAQLGAERYNDKYWRQCIFYDILDSWPFNRGPQIITPPEDFIDPTGWNRYRT